MSAVDSLGLLGCDFPPTSTRPLLRLLSEPLPRWAITCEAAEASNESDHLAHGAPFRKAHRGLQRCGFCGCPTCNGEVFRRHRRTFQDRLALQPEGLSYAHITITVPDVPLGKLQEARALVSDTLSRAVAARSVKAAYARHGVRGRFSADHVTLTWMRLWHPHRHLLLVAEGDAVAAGEVLAEAYRARLGRAGKRITPHTVHVTDAPTPKDLIAYLCRPWTREPNNDGSLDGMGLAARGLQGDPVCAQAYRELMEAIARRSLFRGTGCLGRFKEQGDCRE